MFLQTTRLLQAVTLVALHLAAVAVAAGSDAETLAAQAVQSARSDQGLCLNLGTASGGLTAALAKKGRLQVQTLVRDREQAAGLRQGLQDAGVADVASVVWWRTAHLPHQDDLVNLVVADGWGAAELKGVALSDVVRVLCPGGVAIIGSDSGNDTTKLLADAAAIKLAKAEKLPRAGGWIKITKQMNPAFGEWSGFSGGPELNRVSPDTALALPATEIRWINSPTWAVQSFRNAVYAGGRSFHLESFWKSPTSSQCFLVARDAFNGCELWREPVTPRGGVPLDHSLCADEKNVFCNDGNDYVARDAATGKISRKYGSAGEQLVSIMNDCLIIGGNVVERESGKIRWSRKVVCQPAAAAGTVYAADGKTVEAIKLADGKTVWKVDLRASSLMLKGSHVFVENRGDKHKGPILLTMLDRQTGATVWAREHDYETVVYPYADAVYVSSVVLVKGNPGPKWTEWDIKTGKDVRVVASTDFTGGRCWVPPATERYISAMDESRFFDRKTNEILVPGRGIRSQCKIGPAFAYGLMYSLPHACNCGTVLRGVTAVSGGSTMPKGEVAPALVTLGAAPAGGTTATPGDWSCYRSDPSRSSSIATELPAELKPLWSVKVGKAALTQATGAGALAYVAEPDARRVVAVEMVSGKIIWSFITEGRVALPPTLAKGLCLVADNAGWVYALNAASGKVVWQFQAAPEQKYMCAYSQLESSWPVRSGVVVLGDVACFAAGRIGMTDGGVHVYAVEVTTGQQRWHRTFKRQMPNDLIVSDGTNVYLERLCLNSLDGADARPIKAGQILHSNGYQTSAGNSLLDLLSATDPGQSWTKKGAPGNARGYGDMVAFSKERTVFTFRPRPGQVKDDDGGIWRCQVCSAGASAWSNKTTTLQMLGMVLAGSRVYCAGIPEFRDMAGGAPALTILAAADGKELQRLPLDSTPCLDGVSAVGNRLLVATTDGKLLCFEGKK